MTWEDEEECLKVVALLLKYGANPEAKLKKEIKPNRIFRGWENGVSPLDVACNDEMKNLLINYEKILDDSLLNKYIPKSYNLQERLFEAIERKDPEGLRILLGMGADPNRRNRMGLTPLRIVA